MGKKKKNGVSATKQAKDLTLKKLIGKKTEIFFWTIFVLAIVISICFRIIFPSQDLITPEGYNFPDVDSYYHLWQADYTYENWPKVETYTTLLYWPDGQGAGLRALNSWLIATIAKFSGFTVNQVGFYYPAVLGILILIPVLFIGWIVWNRWAGLIAVATLSVIQGEFYGRLTVGVCDQHALEAFITTLLMLLVVLQFKKHWLWCLASGFMLGMYYIAWAGAPIFTVILLIVLVVQSIINQYKGTSNKMLTFSMLITLGLAMGIFSIWNYMDIKYMLVYGISVSVPVILQSLSRYIRNPHWFTASVFISAIVGFAGLYLYNPDLIRLTLIELQSLTGTIGVAVGDLGSTISEVQPLFFPYDKFTFDLAFGCFGLVFIFGLLGIIFSFKTKGKSEILLMLVWGLIIFMITTFQRRYGYYLAINLCLMSGFISWWLMNKFGWRDYNKKQKKEGLKGKYFSPVMAVVGATLILITMVIPNAFLTSSVTHTHPYALTKAWKETLTFLKEKTPYPADYGVISWWDYGYWIAREGQRPVPCHPGGGSTDRVAKIFVADTTEVSNNWAKTMKSKYVVIDYQMCTFKFYAIPRIAGKGELTEEQKNNTLLYRLYYSKDGINGYKQVFESSTKYDGQAQVKVYEIYDYQEPCSCGK
jgi:dolichyl-diphosphooligosaccharide--protein glycosyltransferase